MLVFAESFRCCRFDSLARFAFRLGFRVFHLTQPRDDPVAHAAVLSFGPTLHPLFQVFR